MEIEHIEQWVGREVVDNAGDQIGKLEQVYFAGQDAVLAEIKPGGLLTRKRLLVPLAGSTVTRDFVRVPFAADNLLEEVHSGAGFDAADLEAVASHYGAAHTYDAADLESSAAREERLQAEIEARRRVEELDAAALKAGEDAEAAANRAQAAQEEAEQAAERHRAARAEADAARAKLTA